jgi:hypothetical protein
MSADLFRREALEYWSRPRGPGGVLRTGAPWVRWLYWVVLALVAAGLALSLLVPVERTASGPVLVDPRERTFVAVLPAVVGSDVRSGRALRLEMDGPTGRRNLPASVVHVEAADDAATRQAGFRSFPRPGVLATGVLAPEAAVSRAPPHLAGRAVIGLGSQQAASLFLQGFRAAPDKGDG